jgi:hypothetical protein
MLSEPSVGARSRKRPPSSEGRDHRRLLQPGEMPSGASGLSGVERDIGARDQGVESGDTAQGHARTLDPEAGVFGEEVVEGALEFGRDDDGLEIMD